jgi:hypothetical protein
LGWVKKLGMKRAPTILPEPGPKRVVGYFVLNETNKLKYYKLIEKFEKKYKNL